MLRNKQTWLSRNHIKVQINWTTKESEEVITIYQKNRKTMEWQKLPQSINVKNHKYGKSCVYALAFPWDFDLGKRVTMTVQRLVYLYFNGDIPEGYDIDHKDNDSLNNLPSNLQAITRKENLMKREKTAKQISKDYRQIEKEMSKKFEELFEKCEELQ